MKKTDVVVRKGTIPVSTAIETALLNLRKKLKVGSEGGMPEDEWYGRCAEALVIALEHVGKNLPDFDKARAQS
jgi:hypothetical protein